MYFLITDLNAELAEFMLTGKNNEDGIFHVFPPHEEDAMAGHWEELSYEVKLRRQQICHMRHTITIEYLEVRSPETGASISLVPWFLLPGRRYPVFVYLYAIWHYHRTGKKSLDESASAAGKVFRVEQLNKSTVFRSIKAMERSIDIARIDEPLSSGVHEAVSREELLERIPEILEGRRSIGSLREIYGEMVKPLPVPVRQSKAIGQVLSNIPDKLSNVIKPRGAAGRKVRDARKRPARARKGGGKERVQRIICYAESWEIERIRMGFIEISRSLVMDAAVKYNRFLV